VWLESGTSWPVLTLAAHPAPGTSRRPAPGPFPADRDPPPCGQTLRVPKLQLDKARKNKQLPADFALEVRVGLIGLDLT